MPYHRLNYHLVWSTKKKQPLLTPENASTLRAAVGEKCANLDALLQAIGGASDHLHLVVAIPPTIAVAEFVRQVKGFSSYQINREFEGTFAWQSEYGAFTLGKHGLPRAIAYVQNQAEHHATGRIFKSVEPPDES